MKIQCFTVGVFRVNTYLVTDEVSDFAAIIDTGESGDLLALLQALEPAPNIKMILLTHGHLDHAGSLKLLQTVYDVPTYLPRLEQPLFATLPVQGDWFGEPAFNRDCGRIDHYVDDDDSIQLGETMLRFISTPGHTPGQGCYYTDKDIIVGDTLFAGSVGRYDLPMGNAQVMQQSLRRLLQLPGHLIVHSGHGPTTTLAHELNTNPHLQFLREKNDTNKETY